MTDTLSIGVPVLFNAAMFTVLILYINGKVDGLRSEMNARLEAQTQTIDGLRGQMNARFEAMMQALLRVEGVLDARLKHLEERER